MLRARLSRVCRYLPLWASLISAGCSSHSKPSATVHGDSPAQKGDQRDAGDDSGRLTDPDQDAGREHSTLDGGACAAISEQALSLKKAVDIIFIIDSSSSMGNEIDAVRQLINDDFARIIEESGVDYRVIMFALYGDVVYRDLKMIYTGYPICIGHPLGGNTCAGLDEPLRNNDRFFQFSAEVQSQNAWCEVLRLWNAPDPGSYGKDVHGQPWTPRAPDGWRKYLREGAFKSFVVISDDTIVCSPDRQDFPDGPTISSSETPSYLYADDGDTPENAVSVRVSEGTAQIKTKGAKAFDEALRKLSPAHFGTAEHRTYKVHSIVGLAADGALGPEAPLARQTCLTADAAGIAHQELSILTGGLRYPVCFADNFDEIFHALAKDTTTISQQLSCDWAIPSDPKDIDPALVNLNYAPTDGTVHTIPKVPDLTACDDAPNGEGWYYDDAEHPLRIISCPATCDKLSRDRQGAIRLAFGCETVVL